MGINNSYRNTKFFQNLWQTSFKLWINTNKLSIFGGVWQYAVSAWRVTGIPRSFPLRKALTDRQTGHFLICISCLLFTKYLLAYWFKHESNKYKKQQQTLKQVPSGAGQLQTLTPSGRVQHGAEVDKQMSKKVPEGFIQSQMSLRHPLEPPASTLSAPGQRLLNISPLRMPSHVSSCCLQVSARAW